MMRYCIFYTQNCDACNAATLSTRCINQSLVLEVAEPEFHLYRTTQHVECVKYLLDKGADPCSETETGDNCLHMAAKNGYTECMNEILQASVAIGTAEPARLADTVLPYSTPVKFVDLRNSKS